MPKMDPIDRLARELGLGLKTSTKYTRNREEKVDGPQPNFLSLKRLFNLSWTNEPDSSNANYVRLLKLRVYREGGTPTVSTQTLTRIPNEEERVWDQTISCVPEDYNGKVSQAPGIKVYCSCPRFKYMWDYPLFTIGASDGLACQGIPCDETNPTLKIAACKHLVRITSVLLGRNL